MSNHAHHEDVQAVALGDFRTWLCERRKTSATHAVMDIRSLSDGRDGVFALDRLKPALEADAAIDLVDEYIELFGLPSA